MKLVINFLFSILFITVQAEEWLQNFDSYIEKTMQEWDTPGLAIAIVKDEQIIYAKGFGLCKIDSTEKVDENTIFAIASCTKAFTATALGLLVDEGKISWDEKPKNHLNNFELYDPFVTKEITITDLLCHKSGLEKADGIWLGSALSREELLQKLPLLKPVSSFRSSYDYNNLMYLVAGEMIPSICKSSWDDFIKERIFNPLSMNRSTTYYDDLVTFTNVSTPHHKNTDGTLVPIKWRNMDNIAPAGGINSSVNDLAKWMILNLNNGFYEGTQIVNEKTIQELHSPKSIINSKNAISPFHFNLYGIGWMINDYQGYKLVQHSGAIDGMHSQIALLPEEKLGIVVLTNMDLRPITTVITLHVLDLFLKNPESKDWNSIFLQFWNSTKQQLKLQEDKLEESRVKNTSPSLNINEFTGKFHNKLYGDLDLFCDENNLLNNTNPFLGGKIEHWQENTFIFDSEKNGISFPYKIFYEFIIKNGKVEAVHLKANSTVLVLDEVFTKI